MPGTVQTFDTAQTEIAQEEWGSRCVFDGQVTRDTIAPVFGWTMEELAARSPLVTLADFRSADATIAARLAVQAYRRSGHRAVWPTALVVPEAQAELWRLYADLQARGGVWHKVFTSLEEGERWAADMAALRAAQARFLKRAR
jgi:hypothetical protein